MTDTSRASLIKALRTLVSELFTVDGGIVSAAADMLEADANLRTQLARRAVERDIAISMGVEGDAQQVAVPVAMFPTMGTIQEVIDHANAQLPILTKNELHTILMSYHNTLLAHLSQQTGAIGPIFLTK